MVFIALCAAALGGIAALKLKIPAGALLGAMMGAALLNLVLGSEIHFPIQIKFVTQAMTGAYIGSKISKGDLLALRGILVPALLLSVTMFCFNIVMGWGLFVYGGVALETALFATAPAGITDMTLASMEFGADAPKVAVLQMVRLLSVLSVTPFFVTKIGARPVRQPTGEKKQQAPGPGIKKIANTAFIGLAFGGVGYLVGVPAGAISFALLGCAAYNIAYQDACIPLKLRHAIQIVAGALIGGMVTRTQLAQLSGMLPVVAVVIAGFLLLNLCSAVLLHKVGGMELVTAVLASSAGGLTDMAVIAEEMGAESAKVATMQLIRVVSVIALYPALISKLLQLL